MIQANAIVEILETTFRKYLKGEPQLSVSALRETVQSGIETTLTSPAFMCFLNDNRHLVNGYSLVSGYDPNYVLNVGAAFMTILIRGSPLVLGGASAVAASYMSLPSLATKLGIVSGLVEASIQSVPDTVNDVISEYSVKLLTYMVPHTIKSFE